mmetsp:Transcript_15092/g.22614  ORF Transcript_15092/g.22614 Transcript_15092/m.22614 type:complete len:88 (+) Transcript_15092:106-369(+)
MQYMRSELDDEMDGRVAEQCLYPPSFFLQSPICSHLDNYNSMHTLYRPFISSHLIVMFFLQTGQGYFYGTWHGTAIFLRPLVCTGMS